MQRRAGLLCRAGVLLRGVSGRWPHDAWAPSPATAQRLPRCVHWQGTFALQRANVSASLSEMRLAERQAEHMRSVRLEGGVPVSCFDQRLSTSTPSQLRDGSIHPIDGAHRRWQVLAELERLCGALPARADAWAWAECVVCMAAPRGTRLRPCCHALLCAPCAADLVRRGDACPACRAGVERYEEGAFDATYAPA